MPTTYTRGLALGKPAAGASGWNVVLDANSDKIDAALRGLAVRPAELDASGNPVGLGYVREPGWVIVDGDSFPSYVSNTASRTANASGYTYVWMEADETRSGTDWPEAIGDTDARGIIPLARITADSTKITLIEDLRSTPRPILEPGPLRVGRTTKTQAATFTDLGSANCYYHMDATLGAQTVNLPPVADDPGRVYVISKRDITGNAVTVAATAPDTIDGQASVVLTDQYDRVMVLADRRPGQDTWAVLSGRVGGAAI